MSSLGIDDITIGYSKRGVERYARELADGVVTDVTKVISSGEKTLTNQLKDGWSGAACEKFIAKLDESTDKLKEILKDMADSFEAAVYSQQEQYAKEDDDMTDVISGQQIL